MRHCGYDYIIHVVSKSYQYHTDCGNFVQKQMEKTN